MKFCIEIMEHPSEVIDVEPSVIETMKKRLAEVVYGPPAPVSLVDRD